MIIELQDIGKRYNKRWIFKGINETINVGGRVAIVGRNGSGKSTLLKIIGGFISASSGSIIRDPVSENPQLQMNFAAPYQNLLGEYTLIEQLEFHAKYRSPVISFEEMMTQSGLLTAKNELIEGFSSGMKQRLKLCCAFFFHSKVVLLDEPTSNLDDEGIAWYQKILANTVADQTIIIASNQPLEYAGFSQIISINSYQD